MNFGSEKRLSGSFNPAIQQQAANINTETTNIPGISDLLNQYIKTVIPTGSNEQSSNEQQTNFGSGTGFSWGNVLDNYMKKSFDAPVDTQKTENFVPSSGFTVSNDEKSLLGRKSIQEPETYAKKAEFQSSSTRKSVLSAFQTEPRIEVSEVNNQKETSIYEDSQSFLNVTRGFAPNESFVKENQAQNYTREKTYKTLMADTQIFEYNNFNTFVSEMAKPIKQQDVRTKLSELKGLVGTFKEISKQEFDDDDDSYDDILRDFLKKPHQMEGLPLYKTSSSLAPDYSKKFISAGGKPHEMRSEFQSNNEHKPDGMLSGVKSRSTRGADKDQFDEHVKENQIDSHEDKTSTPQTKDKEVKDPILQQIEKETGLKATDPQVKTLLTNLQFFLGQNLMETLELKDHLRKGGMVDPQLIANGANVSEMLASAKGKKPDVSTSMNHSNILNVTGINVTGFGATGTSKIAGRSPIREELDTSERKIHEGQADRLIAKINFLNKQIEELQRNKSERFSLSPSYSLKSGLVKISKLVNEPFDIDNFRYEDIESQYKFAEKFLVVAHAALLFYHHESELVEPFEIYFSEIEEIIYIEDTVTHTFLIKMLEKGEENHNLTKSELIKNKMRQKRDKKHPYSGMTRFYLLTVDSPKEFPLWDYAFFLVNIRICFGNSLPYLSEQEVLNAFQQFITSFIADSTNHDGTQSEKSVRFESASSTPKTLTPSEKERMAMKMFMARKSKAMTSEQTLDIEREEYKNAEHRRDLRGDQKRLSTKEGFSISEIMNELPDRFREKSMGAVPQLPLDKLGLSESRNFGDDPIALSNAKTFLRGGVEFIKYGNWGKPHKKLVRLSDDGRFIEWLGLPEGKKSEDSIDLSKSIKIEEGKDSGCFKRLKKKGEEILKTTPEKANLYFTIAADNRVLDLEASEETHKTEFVNALKLLLRNTQKDRASTDGVIHLASKKW